MFDTKTHKRIPAGLLFCLCAIVGAVCFIGIYGAGVLDFTNTGWLFDNDHDLRQHYIGWCHFRTDPWHFPIGLIDSLSYPNSMSVIYTDSIPLFAVLFKIISPYLPQTFQYFGLFGIMTFMLMGGFSSILLRRFINDDFICAIGSVFYVLSAPVIQRMYYHTALSAQWLIVAALVLWVYNSQIVSDARRIAYWGILAFLCVAIHSYFLPMVGMIMGAVLITQYFEKAKLIVILSEPVAFCPGGLLNLFILGGFYGDTSPVGPGLGTFGSNLNTFINPWEIGRILPQLPLQNMFQYEGMAYLGAGILLLYIVVAIGIVFRTVRKIPEEAFHSSKIYGRVTVGLVAVSFAVAVIPNISFNELTLIWLPLPGIVEKVMGIFRSNGRLVWPAMYVLMTCAISFAAYTFRRYGFVARIIVAGALILQITDMSDAFRERYDLYTSLHPIETMWDDEEAGSFTEGAKEFIFLYPDNDITMQTAYYGYLHNMRQNNFYFARDIDDKVREAIDLYYAELDNGNIRQSAIYVLRDEDYDKDPSYYEGLDVSIMRKSGHVMFKADPKVELVEKGK